MRKKRIAALGAVGEIHIVGKGVRMEAAQRLQGVETGVLDHTEIMARRQPENDKGATQRAPSQHALDLYGRQVLLQDGAVIFLIPAQGRHGRILFGRGQTRLGTSRSDPKAPDRSRWAPASPSS